MTGMAFRTHRTTGWRPAVVWLPAAWILLTPAGARGDQTELPLWPVPTTGQAGAATDPPRLILHLPAAEKRCGTAMVICPGGGYRNLALDHEGRQVADWLDRSGIAAFVLVYRHRGSGFGHPAPLEDVKRAVRLVRHRADEWGLSENRIGVLGFSAGGHLASTAGTHFDGGDPAAGDPVERRSSRPDFLVLVYPVISMTEPWLHRGSRDSLLGEPPDPAAALALSSEKQVTPRTPPAFLVHSTDDVGVPVENSLAFYAALRRASVPAELHVFQKGGHGYGLGRSEDGTDAWPGLCEAWLRGRGWLPPRPAAGRP